MSTTWLSGAKKVDLHGSRGNGPFGKFLGVILHVNVDEHGTSDDFWRHNSGQVTPNFQVYKDGSVHQILPFNWQPWCQVNGNFNYAAIETAGMPNEYLTDAQCHSIARILGVYHREHGMSLRVANHPGEKGFGIHKMGGAGWGGHNCPGDKRAGQRAHILSLVGGSHPAPPAHKPTPHPTPSGKHLRRAWTLPSGHYYGLISGPAKSHGGFNASERDDVAAIQDRLAVLGHDGGKKRDPRGKFENSTKASVANWQHAHRPGTQYYGQVWHDDWNALFTY